MKFISNLTETVAKYSTGMANKLQNLNDSLHGKMGYERKIIIGEHKIYVRYKPKGHTSKYSGNSGYYANGEIYLKGYANPIEISPKEESNTVRSREDIELVASSKYRNAVQNKIISQALNTPSDEYTLAEKLLIALVGMVALAITTGALIYMM